MKIHDQVFFVIDSDNLDKVKDKFIGYLIARDTDSIYENDEAKYPYGAFIDIHIGGEKIVIHQDFTGNFHLFLYKKDNYFAISDSLLSLAEYLSSRTKLTLNRAYAAALLDFDTNPAVTQTIFNEITLLPCESIIEIDKKTKELTLNAVSITPDLSIALDSNEGMRLLDAWHQKWVGIYQTVKSRTCDIKIDLTGGFDSRLNFALVLCSKINLNDIVCCTIKSRQSVDSHGRLRNRKRASIKFRLQTE